MMKPGASMTPPRFLTYDRAGVAHLTDTWGKGEAYCGLPLYNFHARISLRSRTCGDGHHYTPPLDARATCLSCVARVAP